MLGDRECGGHDKYYCYLQEIKRSGGLTRAIVNVVVPHCDYHSILETCESIKTTLTYKQKRSRTTLSTWRPSPTLYLHSIVTTSITLETPKTYRFQHISVSKHLRFWSKCPHRTTLFFIPYSFQLNESIIHHTSACVSPPKLFYLVLASWYGTKHIWNK